MSPAEELFGEHCLSLENANRPQCACVLSGWIKMLKVHPRPLCEVLSASPPPSPPPFCIGVNIREH